MAEQRRRTEIQIETHEITIIRFGKIQSVGSVDKLLEQADVIAHGEIDASETPGTDEKEKRNED